jgi:hypothetical protein
MEERTWQEEGERLRRALGSLGWEVRHAARQWSMDYRTLERWIAGETRIPAVVWRTIQLEQDRAGLSEEERA